MDLSQEKLLSIGIVILLGVSGLATIVYYKDDVLNSNSGNQEGWIDPITEVENCENCTGQDANHQHTDIMQHFLQTHNVTLIDYHNLNCDGKERPDDGALDDSAGRACKPEYKNLAPTPGDNSEIAIEGNFLEDCEIYADGSGGCFAYVSSYNQFEILD
ncbi:uncharacterized protein METZ01_LOCUS244477, partial [marine metagenome]